MKGVETNYLKGEFIIYKFSLWKFYVITDEYLLSLRSSNVNVFPVSMIKSLS